MFLRATSLPLDETKLKPESRVNGTPLGETSKYLKEIKFPYDKREWRWTSDPLLQPVHPGDAADLFIEAGDWQRNQLTEGFCPQVISNKIIMQISTLHILHSLNWLQRHLVMWGGARFGDCTATAENNNKNQAVEAFF